MKQEHSFLRLFLIVAFLAAPAVAVRVISVVFDAPYLQPLGLTQENVAASAGRFASSERASVNVMVKWGRDWQGAMTQAELRHLVERTLSARTDFYLFKFSEEAGGQIDVTYVVGPNRFGPYPPSQMMQGIRPAVMALEMTNGRVR